jgi:ribose 5-phosphate isomerase A
MLSPAQKKRLAAEAAVGYIESGSVLGIGTGSTVAELIEVLKDRKIKLAGAVSSSNRTSEALGALGIPLVDLNATGDLDLYIDGADETDERGVLIKGGGGALTREKIIAACSRKFVCIVDDSKVVAKLGAFPLPVEVIPMARAYVARELSKLGGHPVLREGFTTDNGNVILDVHKMPLDSPARMEDTINGIAGVVTVGLFAHRGADVLLIASDSGTKTIVPARPAP